MAISQNLKWTAAPPVEDEADHPPGKFFIEFIKRTLSGDGWRIVEGPDNWRDAGWFLIVRRDGLLEIALAQIAVENDWMLQIAPEKYPGPIGRLLGQTPSASPSEVLALARDVHAAMMKIDGVTAMSWRPDGMPSDREGSPTPTWD